MNHKEKANELLDEFKALKTMTRMLSVEEEWANVALLSMKAIFPKWNDMEGIIKEKELVRYETEIEVEATDEEEAHTVYEDSLFKCLKEHTKEEHLHPVDADYLFVRVVPEGEIEEWEQRDYRNPYQVGDKVYWDDETYVCVLPDTTYNPTDYPQAWELVE